MRTIITIGLIWLGVAVLIAWWWHRPRAREKRLIGQLRLSLDDLDAEDEPERDFMMERAKLEAQREDAEEARQEVLREGKS